MGHIFQLGNVYSQAMNCGVLGPDGKNVILEMGCYGIGVSRVVASAIEQNHDNYGIIWPDALAPFQVAIVPLNAKKSPEAEKLSDHLYRKFKNTYKLDALLDDRQERPGVMFADMELIGIPHVVIVGGKSLIVALLNTNAVLLVMISSQLSEITLNYLSAQLRRSQVKNSPLITSNLWSILQTQM